MPTQKEIIGDHPVSPNIFDTWLENDDVVQNSVRCHRSLSSKLDANNAELISWFASKIIEHHYSPLKLRRLKKKYTDIGFPKYAKQHRQIPKVDRTKKGNGAEIILIEYIINCQQAGNLIKYYKFRYNPNVDQSMKGDDALIIDILNDEKGKEEIKVFLGEAKFRSTPDKEVIKQLSESLGKDKLPLSYTFMVDRLYEDPATEYIAEFLELFVMDEVKAKNNLNYAGLLLSNSKTASYVETHFQSDNPNAIIISLQIDNPKQLIDEAFKEAENLLSKPLGI